MDAVRSELAKLLASPCFASSERLAAFLSYVVGQTLEGKGDALKEYPIAVEVFGKPESFDSRLDTIVRVQASKLRSKLKEYYADEGARDSIRIGGYRDCGHCGGDRLFAETPCVPLDCRHGAAAHRRRSVLARIDVPGKTCAVVVSSENISLSAHTFPGRPVILENSGGQDTGIAFAKPGATGEGYQTDPRQTLHGGSLEGFTVRNFNQDGIFLFCADDGSNVRSGSAGNFD